MTALIFCNYSVVVETELKSLEQKLNQIIELCQRLRSDNQELRQQLAAAMDQTKRLEEKITSAMSRQRSRVSASHRDSVRWSEASTGADDISRSLSTVANVSPFVSRSRTER